MNQNETDFKKSEEQLISEALQKSRKSPPQEISYAIRQKAKIKANKKVSRATFYRLPIRGMGLAACLILSFYFGSEYEEYSSNVNNGSLPSRSTTLEFQGGNAGSTEDEIKELSREALLRKIAESALVGDINEVERLTDEYKKRFSKDNR